MNAGLPGAGIGGVFYLLSALLMPVRHAYARVTGRDRSALGGWRVAFLQAGQALAIIAAMWGTGWLLARLRWQARLATIHGVAVPLNPHANVIGGVAIGVSLGSLILVLAGVELLGMLMRRAAAPAPAPIDDDQETRSGLRTAAAVVLLASALGLAYATPLRGQTLADSGAPRPTRVTTDTTRAGLDFARSLGKSGRLDAAIAAYRKWLAGHPDDATAWYELGRLNQRVGRPHAAADAYTRSMQLQAEPGTARRLRDVHLAMRPTVEPLVGGSTDSDGNQRLTAGASVDIGSFDRARLGLRVSRTRVTPGIPDTATLGGTRRGGPGMGNGAGVGTVGVSGAGTSSLVAATLQYRPRADLSLDGFAGEAFMQLPGEPAWYGPAVRLRLRSRPGPGLPALEVRGSTLPVDASSGLIAAGAWRDEVGGMLELPLGALRVRGQGRLGDIRVTGDRNTRYAFGGALALVTSPAVELSGQFQQSGYGHEAPGGYFAPRFAQAVEAGAYIETDLGDHVSFAADLGAGVSRFERFARVATGGWGPSLRAWSMLTWTVVPGWALNLEAEGYDSRAGESVVAVPATSWRYGSLNLSTRVTF